MNIALLSLEQTPPFSVPLRFFLTAPLFGLAAVVLALISGPEMLGSRWQPSVLAFTHLLTLGYLAMVMAGAMFQLMPVLVGVRIEHPQLVATVVHALLSGGTLLLAAAFLLGPDWLYVAALAALAIGLGVFIVTMAHAIWHARSSHDTICAMRLAITALAITLLLGLLRGGGHLSIGVVVGHVVTDLHLAWGLLGWSGLLLVGVAYQVVPMFQITQEYPPRLRYWFPWLVTVLLVVWSMLSMELPQLSRLPGLGLVLAYGVFAVVTLRLQAKRLRRLPDVTVDFWRLGLVSMLLAGGLWLLQTWWPVLWSSTTWPLGWGTLVIIGAGVAVISGMMYKIVPFLVWLHLNNRLQQAGAWQGKVPTMRQVIAEAPARRQLWAHAAATATLLASSLLPSLFYPALLLLGASFALQLWNLAAALRVYRRVLSSIVTVA